MGGGGKMDIWYKNLNIVALLLVPIVAVIVGQKLQERAEKREDKMQIFKVLMTSRGLGWSQDMVWALNIIERSKLIEQIANSLDFGHL